MPWAWAEKNTTQGTWDRYTVLAPGCTRAFLFLSFPFHSGPHGSREAVEEGDIVEETVCVCVTQGFLLPSPRVDRAKGDALLKTLPLLNSSCLKPRRGKRPPHATAACCCPGPRRRGRGGCKRTLFCLFLLIHLPHRSEAWAFSDLGCLDNLGVYPSSRESDGGEERDRSRHSGTSGGQAHSRV